VVAPLPPAAIARLATLPSGALEEILSVRVAGTAAGTGALPAVLGSIEVADAAIRFRPLVSFTAGMEYRARFDGAAIGVQPVLALDFTMPMPPTSVPTRVARVHPGAARVPSNMLRLYVHFTAPMLRRGITQHVRLLDAEGAALVLPFAEIDQGLWDPGDRRLTLFVHPGRIKRGVAPREEMGPVLEPGRLYRLVIDRELRDAEGQPLAASFEQTFRTLEEDLRPPDPSLWKLTAPRAPGEAIALDFGEPLDSALLQRLIRVEDEAGADIAGTVSLGAQDASWSFQPAQPWKPGSYRILVDPRLEDLAGNAIGHPFEIAPGSPAAAPRPQEPVVLSFTFAPAR